MPSQSELSNGYDGLPLIEADNRALENIDFFDDWVSHNQKDDYWLNIDGEKRAENIVAPVLLIGGWFDPFLPSQLEDFNSLKNNRQTDVANKSRLIIGPWAHAETIKFPDGFKADQYRKSVIASSVDWFDHILGYKNNYQPNLSPVRIFVMGKNIWRDENEWPLKRAKITPLYLTSKGNASSSASDGKLLFTMPELEAEIDSYTYDPSNPVPSKGGAIIGKNSGIKTQNSVEERNDVLLYTTQPLNNEIEVTGPIEVTLHVQTSAPNTDFTAKLVDIHPNGHSYNVTDGIIRRNYSTNSNTKPIEIAIQLWPTSMVFKKGHKIGLELSSSNFPRYDRNPNTGGNIATEKNMLIAKQSIYHGNIYPSRIMLPVIP